MWNIKVLPHSVSGISLAILPVYAKQYRQVNYEKTFQMMSGIPNASVTEASSPHNRVQKCLSGGHK